MLARNATDVLRILSQTVQEGVKETLKVASNLTVINNSTSVEGNSETVKCSAESFCVGSD
jgi:hypothetical protein